MEKERRRESMWPDMSGVPLPYGYQRIFHRNTAEKESVRGKKMNKGLIHLYTGEGKGKTTAAMGLALRAAGAGKKCLSCSL